jgi:DNA-binding response OmpR family regulator
MNTKHQLLLVEDDSSLGYLLSEYLKMKGFGIAWVKDGKQALKKLEDQRYDLCILDVMMPEMDGYALAEQIKSTYPEVPFIFLTAKSMKIDALKGLNIGAIDYLRKPIDEEELVMRLEILLNRNESKNPSQDANPVYHIGEYVFSPRNQLLKHPDEAEIQMTHRESELLMMLVKSEGQLCKHKDILDKLWGKNDYFNRKSMSVFITRLRKYLAKDENIHIENVHNQGFILKTMP